MPGTVRSRAGLALVQQILAVIGGHRPVVVLATAVDAGKGLWMSSISPCCWAIRRMVDMTTMLWSEPTDVASNTGAISNCAGATSLWRVLAGMPRRHSSRSRSIMNARTRCGSVRNTGLRVLALGRRRAEECPAGQQRSAAARPGGGRPGSTPARPDVGEDARRARVAEPAQHAQCLLAQGVLRAQQRDLVVERLTRERDVGRDGQRHAVWLDRERSAR